MAGFALLIRHKQSLPGEKRQQAAALQSRR